MSKGFTDHEWQGPAGYRFAMRLGASSYRVEVYKDGALIERSGKDRRPHWGPSLTDALSGACYHGDPSRALGAIGYLFTRIDREFTGDRTLIRDLFAESKYVGETGAQRRERWQPYHDAMKRAHDRRFGGGWGEAHAEAQRIKVELERQDAEMSGAKVAA